MAHRGPSLHGDTAVIAYPRYRNWTGAVAIYQRSDSGTWGLVSLLSHGNDRDYFGATLDLHGDNLVIGTNSSDADPAYLYSKTESEWTFVRRFYAPGAQATPGNGWRFRYPGHDRDPGCRPVQSGAIYLYDLAAIGNDAEYTDLNQRQSSSARRTR